jgi:hypothetical protein
LEGFAKMDGRAAPGAMILLFPRGEPVDGRFVWRYQSDLDGSFRLSRIPPGRYTLLAIDDGWELEWQRAEILERYLKLGVEVTIPESGDKTMKLPDALVVQPR